MISTKHYAIAAESHIGHRESNQDAFGLYEDPLTHSVCIMVADGLGGHPGGEIASQLIIDKLKNLLPSYGPYFKQDGISATESLVQEACHALRSDIREKHGALDAHTTLALAWLDQEKWVSCHVGDSRIYLIDNNQIIWRTKDHTPVENLYLEGKISEASMYSHPMQNILLRSISTQVAPELEITLHPSLEQNQTLLACSDGFWGKLSYSDIINLTQHKLSDLLLSNIMTDLIHSNKSQDNLTGIILKPI